MSRIAARAFAVIVLTVALGQPALAASRVEDFYGIWVDKAQSPFDCAQTEGEGPWITIGKNLYIQPSADPCEDVEMIFRGGKLRVSASCSGDEEGFTAVTAEFHLNGNGELVAEDGVYVRCQGQLPQWYRDAQ